MFRQVVSSLVSAVVVVGASAGEVKAQYNYEDYEAMQQLTVAYCAGAEITATYQDDIQCLEFRANTRAYGNALYNQNRYSQPTKLVMPQAATSGTSGSQCTTYKTDVNLRSGGSMNSNIIGTVPTNSAIRHHSSQLQADGYRWSWVSLDFADGRSRDGWVRSDLISCGN